MSKSFVIIDTPKNCGECSLMHYGVMTLEPKCILNKKSHDVFFEIRDDKRPNWCPLKDYDEMDKFTNMRDS